MLANELWDASVLATRRTSRLRLGPSLLVLALGLSGCVNGALSRHTLAFSHAADLITESTENAYRAANRLRHQENIVKAIGHYGETNWKPDQELAPLLTTEEIEARLLVLDGLRAYAKTLTELTGKPSDKDKVALDAAASSIGSNLGDLEKTAASDFNKALAGMTSTATLPEMPAMAANIASTAMRGLGDYLIQRKLKQRLPKVVTDEEANVDALCTLMSRDVVILRREADIDYGDLIEEEDHFLGASGSHLDPGRRRDEIARLLNLAAAEKANDLALGQLQKAILDLSLVHHALAAAVQHNDPQGIRQKIAELTAIGQELGTFYKSLPSS